VIIITSNAKKDLSDPFPGTVQLPPHRLSGPKMMRKIIRVHFPELDKKLMENAISAFYPAGDRRHREKTGHPGADQLDPGPGCRSGFPAQGPAQREHALSGGAVQKKPGLRAGQEHDGPAQDVLGTPCF
jgi:hypothetical protein